MSIKLIPESIHLTKAESSFVIKNIKSNSSNWKSNTNFNKFLKEKILNSLRKSHSSNFINIEDNFIECAYCGNWVDNSGRGEIEHIAYKAGYFQFEYLNTNLVYVCSHCNSSSKKGREDVVKNYDENLIDYNKADILQNIKEVYCNLEFTIVHPKLDNPDDHYEWQDSDQILLLGARSRKGENSINMFKLKDPMMTLQRSMQHQQEKDFIENPEAFQQALGLVNKPT